MMDALEPIKQKIYEIRGRRVMLDSDLAALYCVETKNLNRSVRRNLERFPDDFMFQLTKEEYDSLRCQNFTLKNVDNANTMVLTSQKIKQLRTDMNDTLADQNEINESTRAQLDAISDALTELQNQGQHPLSLPEIGYGAIQKRREEEEKE